MNRGPTPQDDLEGRRNGYRLGDAPAFAIGDRARLNVRGLETLATMHAYETREIRTRMLYRDIVEKARAGESLTEDMMGDPAYAPDEQLTKMQDGVRQCDLIGEVVGVFLQYGHVMGYVTNACYLTNGQCHSGPQYYYQLLFRWPHPEPKHGEPCFIFAFSKYDLDHMGEAVAPKTAG